MDKQKILKGRKSSLSAKQKPKAKRVGKKTQSTNYVLRNDANLKEYDPMKTLLDTDKMGAAIMQCLIENDTEGVMEIIESYLYAVNKTQFLKRANLPRSTTYNLFKRRNPTIKTLAKFMSASKNC